MDPRLSVHFMREEFACRGENCCGHTAAVSERLLAGLEELRAIVNGEWGGEERGIRVNSGFRCRVHNGEVKGSVDSYHCTGEAADIWVMGMTSVKLASLAKKVEVFRGGGIGLYSGWVHVDVRKDGPARWGGK
jgi:uncharacterized protein YcbK (DUF882 family)